MKDYNGEGDFALYVASKPDPADDDFRQVRRSHNRQDLRDEALVLASGGQHPYVAIWRWDYDDEADSIEVEVFDTP